MGLDTRRTQTLRDRLAPGVIGQQARIAIGTLNQNWLGTEKAIPAGTLGLSAISNLVLTSGTTLDIHAHARVIRPGSPRNTARIRTYMRQTGKVSVGTRRYTTFSPTFTATPDIILTTGSPTRVEGVGNPYTGSHWIPRIQTQRPGSFSHTSSPSYRNCGYVAVGPGSYPLNYIAIGY